MGEVGSSVCCELVEVVGRFSGTLWSLVCSTKSEIREETNLSILLFSLSGIGGRSTEILQVVSRFFLAFKWNGLPLSEVWT